MKGDFSRRTFDPAKHYSAVLVEQGRMLTDADLEEEHRILAHRIEQGTAHLAAPSGTPLKSPGFGITEGVDAGIANGKILIGPGVYFVDGVLVRNDAKAPVPFEGDGQPFRYDVAWKPGKDERYAFVLNVWRRLVTALDDPSIREVALGGPTTSVREQVVWQVTAEKVANNWTCDQPLPDRVKTPGQMAAQAVHEETASTPCIVPPLAGYTGLENQFYRVEVFRTGEALQPHAETDGVEVTSFPADALNTVVIKDASSFDAGLAVEVFRPATGNDPAKSSLGYVTSKNAGTNTLTLNGNLGLFDSVNGVRVRPVDAVYVASRDNGSVVTSIESISGVELVVGDTGRDDVLGLSANQWVEITDDRVELEGLTRRLYQIASADPGKRTITLRTPAEKLDNGVKGVDEDRHPKLRRWDAAGPIAYKEDGLHWVHLEQGNQVRFTKGFYRSGDYWHFAARAATVDERSGTIEWPGPKNDPTLLKPMGVERHRCVLAWVHVPNSGKFTIHDCRDFFPSLTNMTNLLYVGGDGQEGDPARATNGLIKLPAMLEVRAANGGVPLSNKQVQFRTGRGIGSGQVQWSANIATIMTNGEGIASFEWAIDAQAEHQVCDATLIDTSGKPIPHARVRFNATLDYDPQIESGGGCCVTVGEGGQFSTVQEAIDDHIKNGREGICLCLLAGDHKVDDLVLNGDDLDQLLNLSVKGCGRSTRLLLNDQFSVRGARSLRLADMDIQMEGPAFIRTERVVDVEIDGCRIQGNPEGSLVLLDRARRVQVANNVILAGAQRNFEKVRAIFAPIEGVEFPEWNFDTVEDLRKIIEETSRAFDHFNTDHRVLASRGFRVRAEELADQLTEGEKRALEHLIQELQPSDLRPRFRPIIESIVRASSGEEFGVALTIGWLRPDEMSEVHPGRGAISIEHNTIQGTVSFYGEPDSHAQLTEELLRTVDSLLVERNLQLEGVDGVVHVHDNQLTRLAIGREIAEWAQSWSDGRDEPFTEMFESFHLSNNVVTGGISEVVSRHLTMTANEFALDFPIRPTFEVDRPVVAAMYVIADSAVYTGNHARPMPDIDAAIVDATRAFSDIGNLELLIQ